jgi:hypothetical protein
MACKRTSRFSRRILGGCGLGMASIWIAFAVGTVSCDGDDDLTGNEQSAGGGGASASSSATGAGPSWQPGCGDIVSCSFFFSRLPPPIKTCLYDRCSAEIEACGADGAACEPAIRCGDDLIAADHASGCFTSENLEVVKSWFCYHSRFECMALRYEHPPARDFLGCAIQLVDAEPCIPINNCQAFPPACSAVPPEPACIQCLEVNNCFAGDAFPACHGSCYGSALPCFEGCRGGTCDDSSAWACLEECAPLGTDPSALFGVHACMRTLCAGDCCAD